MRRPLIAVLLLVTVATVWLLMPPPAVQQAAARDASSYEEAFARWQGLRAADALALTPGCESRALLQGARAPRAVLLLHGITNCPLQFAALAESLHATGDNVLVPRLPRHGLADRMTVELASLRAEEVAGLVAECVGVARGFGDTVVVVGLSLTGVATAWAADNLADVDRAIVIAPAFAPPWRPAWLAPLATRLSLRLPNVFVWWDDAKEERLEGPRQCYPRFSTRAMGEGYRFGGQVMVDATRGAPRARSLWIFTTADDRAVDNVRAATLARHWRNAGATVNEYQFAAGDSIVHDMIDPAQVGARVARVYPVLLAAIRGAPLPR
ncbi:MAG: hypothetical protein HOP12_00565 [Candidatus Eisenbacteria bacterium]|uniref:Serine aminopeptidase S33 domain-containing protein n=1 Tax=Eiseniibacteriota bacterium TaxID=2212470 RepID=A0A849SJB8_UNCEI|nr:hypothetical protein [Candidatus Eisenbacteria bacterium]